MTKPNNRVRKGPFNRDEIAYLVTNREKQTSAEMARALRRTPEKVAEHLRSLGLVPLEEALLQGEQDRAEALAEQPPAPLPEGADPREFPARPVARRINAPPPEGADAMATRAALRASEKWRRLKQEFAADELDYFEEEYVKLRKQFRDDVMPSEETQIFDAIKYDILKSRNLVERKKAREEIARLELQMYNYSARFPTPGAMTTLEREFLRKLREELNEARAIEQSRTQEFVRLQERQDALMRALKSTRDQRIKDVETSRDTLLGLFRRLQNEEFRSAEGREAGLMRAAAEKAYRELGALRQYEDQAWDRPILSADTVDIRGEADAQFEDKECEAP